MAGVFKSLNLSDVRVTPFRAYKKWIGSTNLYTQYEGIYSTDSKNLGATFPYITTADYSTGTDKLKTSVYHSTNHLFYKQFYDNTKATFGSGNTNFQDRFIYNFVTVLSLPQNKVGESILPGSVKLGFQNGSGYFDSTDGSDISIIDDSNGNLILNTDINVSGSLTGIYDLNNTLGLLNSGSITQIPSTKHVYRLPTERAVKFLNITIGSESYYNPKYAWNTTANFYNVTPKISPRGISTYFTGLTSSSIEIKSESEDINDLFNLRDADYSLGFFFKYDGGVDAVQTLVEKRNINDVYGMDLNGNIMTSALDRYPYRFTIQDSTGTNGVLTFEKSNGFETVSKTVDTLTPNNWYFVWLARTGSLYELSVQNVDSYPAAYYGSQTIETVIDTLLDKNCANKASIYVGSDAEYSNNFKGELEGLCFFNKYYSSTSQEYKFQIFSGGTNTLNVGNVFYKQGLLTLTNTQTYEQSTPYANQLASQLTYRSTQTIYETEVSCTITPGEFGFSSNPTLHVYDPRIGQFKLRSFATGSDFRPYVTQIGLYDDRGRLLVVGKTSQPIKAPDNVDTTFVLKFDR
jgi:hypothetical protein